MSGNINYDCTPSKRAKAGLEQKAVIINKSDIDMTALTMSGALVTNLSLLSGSTGYSVETIKQLHNTAAAFTANDAGADTFAQSYVGRIWGQGVQDAERARELKDGEFVVVVQTKWGAGTNEAFKVYGLENGLRMTEATFTSIENEGALLFTLSSLEGYQETYPYQIWNEGTYAENKAKFDALFA
ncbi:MAG: hypothetical protein DI539_20860 [Flavobacterium psychrophilum]|nr:MAG: hypothetical protein DI539_20860 [Flavobacterium psychrophilum]